jgi:anti-sigma B factor antagonist
MVVEGELDLADEAAFVDDVGALLDDRAGVVLLDLGAVEFIDSSGVRALLRLHLDHGDQVRLVTASEAVTRVLRIAGVSDMLDGSEAIDT